MNQFNLNWIDRKNLQMFVQIFDFMMKNALNWIFGFKSFGSMTAKIQHSIVGQLQIHLNGHIDDVLFDRIICHAQVKGNCFPQIRFRKSFAQHTPFVSNFDRKFIFRLKVILFGSCELFKFFLTDKVADIFGFFQNNAVDFGRKEENEKEEKKDQFKI